MKKSLLLALLLLAAAIAGCAGGNDILGQNFKPGDYSFHKHTNYIKIHWNLRVEGKRAMADGYVEPFSHDDGLHTVNLELVGLDSKGNIISSAMGQPKDEFIASPFDKSPFEISMPLKGGEKDFTIRGNYYHYPAGKDPDFSQDKLDYIPLK
ncbi:MAG: hypothetical protein ACYDFU_02165 [Nitrospirota bacterium]